MIEDELPGHPALKYLHEAQEAARMGARLNQRLLTFSRRRRLAAQEIHLNDNVIAMSELLRRTLGESITLTTLLAHDLWATRADASEVENAILNLAINARDAMPNGGDLRIETMNVVIEQDVASFEEGFRPGEYVRLSVSDTGTGMAPEVVRRAFEPFYTTKGVDRGTGLGLSTIYGFVKQSGGHVNIYSELGHGTSVNVYLPRIASSKTCEVEFTPGQSPPMGQGETILVVEDNPQVRTLTIERLRRLGYRTLAAENGPSALAVAKDNPTIELAFSDVVMPGGMSGFELAYQLRQLRPGLAILLTSGFAEDAARSGAQVDDDWPVIRKPYAQLDLARKIRQALDTR